MERKILVEVNENELEALKKGLTVKNISTKDLIDEIILRSDDKKTYNGVMMGDAVVDTVVLEGRINVDSNKVFKFSYRINKMYDNN